MSWQRVDAAGPYDEYERADGLATVRVRERPGGGFAVRLDCLRQAPDGPEYRRETADDRETADALAEEWMDAFDGE
ncbi:hypothetical protein HUG10_08320 [Halorarum halophilum]|uniref:Uncharacterized protein n=1 Tax=Halorarum halophilum TaxID=2743090 RepID=A0A7D5KLI7_9EURY|nr:hypothetical protein [Halobaculum halophilum]QLG27555.1 hypothetical protein HUG10_08320 [Halobaculum halophilum]